MLIKRLPNTEEILAAIKANDGYCICQAVKTPETKCMCQDFHAMEEGICHCGMYQKIREPEFDS